MDTRCNSIHYQGLQHYSQVDKACISFHIHHLCMSLIVFSASRRCASASILRQSAPRVRAGAGADIPTELQLRATRSYSSNEHSSANSPSLTLYQYAICPFCHKTKAVLAYAGVDIKVVEVNPLTKAELKPWCVLHTSVSSECRQVSASLSHGVIAL